VSVLPCPRALWLSRHVPSDVGLCYDKAAEVSLRAIIKGHRVWGVGVAAGSVRIMD